MDKKIRGRSVARAIVYLPVIISQFIMGYIWYFFFQFDGGALNDILVALGRQPFDWLANGPRAVWLITGVNTFQYLGVAMIIYLAGLQTIPQDYYESAHIDGAGGYSVFRHITLPLLMPAITTSIVINIIGGLKLFDMIMAMTRGGPGYSSMSLSTLMYNLYFVRYDAGYAAAVGNLMFVLICLDQHHYLTPVAPQGSGTMKKKNIPRGLAIIALCLLYLVPFYVVLGVAFKSPTDTSSKWVAARVSLSGQFRQRLAQRLPGQGLVQQFRHHLFRGHRGIGRGFFFRLSFGQIPDQMEQLYPWALRLLHDRARADDPGAVVQIHG